MTFALGQHFQKKKLDSTKTYMLTSKHEKAITDNHRIQSIRFTIYTEEDQEKLSTLFWLPTLRKRPYKARPLSLSGISCCPFYGGYSDADPFRCKSSIVILPLYGCLLCLLFSCCDTNIVVIFFNGCPLCFLFSLCLYCCTGFGAASRDRGEVSHE